MNNENSNRYIKIHKILYGFILLAILLAGFVGWRLADKKPKYVNNGGNTQTTINSSESTNNTGTDVAALVSFTLPDNWKQGQCEGVTGILVLPIGTSADCSGNPAAPIKLAVDPGNNTDCNQLQNITGVKKHTCISLYINGHKTLKSLTEYPANSSYKQDTSINTYYLDTGKGVVKAEYTYNSDNKYQAGFDELANSLKVK